jgi:large subunit ribosomal protein L19
MTLSEQVGKAVAAQEKTVSFEIGDTIKVHFKIVEGTKERVQVYEGTVIAINGKGVAKNFTVRRISFDVGVERVFPLYSPRIAKIEITKKSVVRRGKLYYLRGLKGKASKLKERRGRISVPGADTAKAAVAAAETQA